MSVSSRSAWSTKQVPGQSGLYREILSQEKQKQKTNQTKMDAVVNIFNPSIQKTKAGRPL